ncbi:hypothetical protein J6590_104316, partial [Homalodisca vitripennis]
MCLLSQGKGLNLKMSVFSDSESSTRGRVEAARVLREGRQARSCHRTRTGKFIWHTIIKP